MRSLRQEAASKMIASKEKLQEKPYRMLKHAEKASLCQKNRISEKSKAHDHRISVGCAPFGCQGRNALFLGFSMIVHL